MIGELAGRGRTVLIQDCALNEAVLQADARGTSRGRDGVANCKLIAATIVLHGDRCRRCSEDWTG
jgi:hypothetical protein